MIIRPDNPSIKGGVQLKRVPVIPWEGFVACGMKVHKDGKIQDSLFAPEPMETADEAFQTLRFLLSAQQGKPGPVAWETVPEAVRRHFKFKDEQSAIVEG